MAIVKGFFINPGPRSLSDLKNDGLYVNVREYDLSELTNITDIASGSIITNISLEITSPYTNSIFEVRTDSGEVIFSRDINDPNIVNTYSSNVFFELNNNADLVIVHTNKTTGAGKLRLELYEVSKTYEPIQTSDSQTYQSTDNQSIDATVEL